MDLVEDVFRDLWNPVIVVGVGDIPAVQVLSLDFKSVGFDAGAVDAVEDVHGIRAPQPRTIGVFTPEAQ